MFLGGTRQYPVTESHALAIMLCLTPQISGFTLETSDLTSACLLHSLKKRQHIEFLRRSIFFKAGVQVFKGNNSTQDLRPTTKDTNDLTIGKGTWFSASRNTTTNAFV